MNKLSVNNNMSDLQFPFFSSQDEDELFAETRYRTGVNKINKLLKKDKSENKPKKLFDANFKPTKKALAYNRKLIREGKTTSYIEKGSLYLPSQGAGVVLKNALTPQGKLKQNLVGKYKVAGQTAIPLKNTRVYTFDAGSPVDFDYEWTNNEDLNNNFLLSKLSEGLSGNYKIIITQFSMSTLGRQRDVGKIIFQDSVDIEPGWWEKNKDKFRVGSGSPPKYVFNSTTKGDPFPQGTGIRIIFTKETQVPKTLYQQKFQHGVTNCLLSPIKDYFLDVVEKRKTEVAKKKALERLNHVFNYICEFTDGVPENRIKEICDKLQIKITLEQPFSNEIYYSYTSMTKPDKTFRLLNTRIDHVDYIYDDTKLPSYDNMYGDATPTFVTKEELKSIAEELGEENYVSTKSNNNCLTSIRTLDKYYAVDNDFYNVVSEFEKETGLRNVAFDSLKYPDLMNFINYGTHFNGTVDFIDTYKWRNIGKNDAPPRNIRHIDQKKAYTNFYKSKFYCKFVGKITDFRKCSNADRVGLYFIKNINLDNCSDKFRKLNERLKWFCDNNIYTKAEIDALKFYGGSFEVTHGAYGIEFDFRFNDAMLNGFEELEHRGKVKYYAKYCGMMSSLRPYKNFYMKGNHKLLSTIKQSNNLKIFQNEYTNEHRIAFRKQYLYTKKHITAQITAYQRLCMLEQLMNMDYDKIARVCVDGVYYFKHDFEMIEGFTQKWDFTFKNEDCENYLSNICVSNDEYNNLMKDKMTNEIAEPREFYLREFFAGAGGTGKTYYNLYEDKGLIAPIYVAPSWKLATDMAKEYHLKTNKKLKVTVVNRLLSDAYIETCNDYNNYIIDEASMILEGQKEVLFEKIKGKIIMIGDLNYQLKPVKYPFKVYMKLVEKFGKQEADRLNSQMTMEGFDNIQTFEKIYRFKDYKLKELAQYIRDNINNVIDLNNLPFIKYVTIEELKNLYTKEDIILRFHNELKPKNNLKYNYTEIFDNIDKYKVTDNFTQYKNGEIVFSKPKGVNKIEKRHGYTTHSVQGLTFANNIFIDITGMKYQNRMIYTAISRANNISQLYIIRDV